MRVRHPRADDDVPGHPSAKVGVDGEIVTVDDDGTFEVPDDATGWVGRFAEAHGVDREDVIAEEDESGSQSGSSDDPDNGSDAADADDEADSAETCQAVKSDGDVCGRELPCRYHSE